MQVISLNIWGGRAGKEKLLGFFETRANTTDIFCLQEIWSAPYEHLEGKLAGGVPLVNEKIMVRALHDISAVLPNHTAFFRPHVGDNYGLLIFIKKKHTVIEEGDVFVYRERGYISSDDIGNHARNIQYATIMLNSRPVTVINFHGLWNGKGKTDTEDRIKQSKNIIAFTKKLAGEYILCGDFNLLLDTESIKLFEEEGMRNLIREHKVLSTRTSLYTKPEKHADYAFVSKGIQVKEFAVLPHEVSDHAPLLIEIQ